MGKNKPDIASVQMYNGDWANKISIIVLKHVKMFTLAY